VNDRRTEPGPLPGAPPEESRRPARIPGPGEVPVLDPRFFARLGLRGGYSTARSASGRELDLDLRGASDPERVLESRRLVLAALGIEPESLVLPEQIHGAGVARVGASERGRGADSPETAVPGADALVTAQPGVAVGCLSADCAVVLLADEDRRAVAAVHCGWRGVAAGVIEVALGELASLGSAPERLFAAVGPAIGKCCYEVGKEVIEALRLPVEESPLVAKMSPVRFRLDFEGAVAARLEGAGVPQGRIERAGLCTACSREPRFFSYRRDGERAGRFLGVISPGG